RDRSCISEILAATPAIPANCQWGTFLRNHDELTLEMVSLSERDFMWAEYAPDERMKCNIGIRRRLAPLVDNDARRIRLLHAELLSLPGSPVLYYGDEISMGDNIWLNDRDGVRTPMQWTDSPTGFSDADPSTFYLPMIEGEYGPDKVSVAAQEADAGSMLHWLRSALLLRRTLPVFGQGTFTDLGGDNLAVLSYLREDADQAVVCVNNLTDAEQSVSLDLARFAGAVPLELFSTESDEPIDAAGAWSATLAPYEFRWLLVGGQA
ncbi:MAG TPA: alpha-glucosidase C-terminal domain-containing protein, partial [Propionibacteriaceae bacterium]|nr:alpha-glucosidase C-terminal domain-containing protein [Propionibacteriaceae bacterium]